MNKLKRKRQESRISLRGDTEEIFAGIRCPVSNCLFAQPDLYYDSQAPDFFDRFYADSLIICGGLWAVLVFLTVKNSFFGRGKQNTDVYRRNCYSIYRFFVVRIL